MSEGFACYRCGSCRLNLVGTQSFHASFMASLFLVRRVLKRGEFCSSVLSFFVADGAGVFSAYCLTYSSVSGECIACASVCPAAYTPRKPNHFELPTLSVPFFFSFITVIIPSALNPRCLRSGLFVANKKKTTFVLLRKRSLQQQHEALRT